MKIKIWFLAMAIALVAIAQAQVPSSELSINGNTLVQDAGDAAKDTSWKKGGTLALNFTQTYLDNWASGGQSSIAGTTLISLFANKKKGKMTWENSINLAYGLINQGENGQWIKADDRIDLSSQYGQNAKGDWYYSGLLNFRTQFAPGYPIVDNREVRDAKLSDLLSPGYGLLALGMEYKPNDNFNFFASPATVKLTLVLDDELSAAGAFGVDPGETSRIEIGGYVRAMYKTKVVENVTYQTKIDLFSNYQNNPGNIDVSWENLISMKINTFMNVTISTLLLYDDDIDVIRNAAKFDDDGILTEPASIGPAVQFKEVFALGLVYNL